MKTYQRLLNWAGLFALAVLGQQSPVLGQGTAFPYHGQLSLGGRGESIDRRHERDEGQGASGNYDFVFKIFDSPAAGHQAGLTMTNSGIPVHDGWFLVLLDPGAGVFDGSDRWLEIAARAADRRDAPYDTRGPRQKLMPAPYAIFAATAGSVPAGTIANAQLSSDAVAAGNLQEGCVTGPKIANGQVVKSLNGLQDAVTLAAGANVSLTTDGNTLSISAFGGGNDWSLTGNAGTVPGINFLGTTDNQPLELRVNGMSALRLEPNTNGAPNIIGGSPVNFIGSSGIVGATIAGGGTRYFSGYAYPNGINSDFGSIGGGFGNFIDAYSQNSTIAGGFGNRILTYAQNSTISGGGANIIQSNTVACTIAGGYENRIFSLAGDCTIGGGSLNTIQTHATMSTIAGGFDNTIQDSAFSSSISGGIQNTIQASAEGSSICGGEGNMIQTSAYGSFVGGGYLNEIQTQATFATISGGQNNSIYDQTAHSTVSGGVENTIQQHTFDATIGGGGGNMILTNAGASTIGGGENNTAGGSYSVVPGGDQNYAGGANSLAAGHRAQAIYAGDFIWADSNDFDFASSSPNQFAARCTGGAVFITGLDSSGNTAAGVMVPAGSGSWSSLSDRSAKENFQAVDAKEVLDRIAAMPIGSWNYKTQEKSIRHLGPMAQDFRAAFDLGEDDRHIAIVDESGVALAAIQGLNQKLEEQRAENAELNRNVAELKKMVFDLSRQIKPQPSNP